MPHRYKALLLNCMDPRLQGENEIKTAQLAGFHPGEYEVLAYAGPSLWMTNPHQPSHAENFWWELENISLKFHNIDTVIIVGHSNCGGFALKGAPADPAEEKNVIVESLKSARQVMLSKHPALGVKLVFVKIEDNDDEESLPNIYPEIVN